MCLFGYACIQVIVTEKVVEEDSAATAKARKKHSRWSGGMSSSGTRKRVVKTVQRKKIITMAKTKSAYLLVYDRKDLHAPAARPMPGSPAGRADDKLSVIRSPNRPHDTQCGELPVRFTRALWEHSAAFLMDKMLFEHSHARESA